MSGSADLEDDATMTRDAGASRTFRSIFGDSASQDGQQDELQIQRFSRHGSDGALVGDSNGYRDSGGDEDDDDDEGVWSDDAAPPKERGKSDGDACEMCGDDDDNNGEERVVSDSAAEQEENASFKSDASAPRTEELKIPHRRSMEEWADDDDEEDTWKDMLQAKVNQLELVIQSNNGATASSSSASSQLAPAAAASSTHLELAHHIESRIALAAATNTVSLRGTADRPASRNKIQRTSGAQSHVSGDHSHHRHVAGGGGGSGVHASATSAVSSPSNYLCKRSGSRDFASSRTSRSTDAKKSAKVTSGSGRRESMTRSSSASSISSTRSRSSRAAQRKNSLDACSVGSHSRSSVNGSLDTLRGSASASGATMEAPEPIRQISDAEAVRRFILHDIKQMSMDRIVADVKRLRFLEDFYQQKHAEEQEKEAAHDHEGDIGDGGMVAAETPLTTD